MSDIYDEKEEEQKSGEENGGKEADLTEGPPDASATKNAGKSDNKDYEDVCFICRRPESKAGKMLSCPTISASAATACTRPWRPGASSTTRGC